MAHLDNLTWKQIQDLGNKMGGEKAIKRFLSGELVLVDRDTLTPAKPRKPILTEVTTVTVPAVVRFTAADMFAENNPAGIRFYLWENFRNTFLGKVEENVPPATLAVHRLERASKDRPIRDELTEAKEETTLAHLYELLKRQPKGENGPLLTNGYASIFYIRDAKGELWAVRASWDFGDRSWSVNANSVGYPLEWDVGYQVVSQAA